MSDDNAKEPKESKRRLSRGRLLILTAAFLVILAGTAVAYQVLKRPPDVDRGEEVTFIPEPAAVVEPPETDEKKQGRQTVNWPMFGFDRARTRHLPVQGIRPPFKQLWRYSDEPLLEFPPIYAHGVLYLVDNDGRAFAFDADTGRKIWTRTIANLNASSPAYSRGRLYIANMRPGQLLCLDAETGRTIWRKPLPARTESSPVVVGGRVYFGAENGILYAVRAKDGSTIWETQLAGEIKAAPAYDNGVLFVGDYGGEMNAVRARDGQIKWQAGSRGASFARTGAFYSTPAVAFGRVYSGNNDSRVYSFDAETGELAWTYSTGGWAYSGPAVAQTRTSPPTVYIGSFDGNIYALDARTGDPRWIKSAGGPVIGSLSVIGNTVYVASFDPKQTRGFAVGSGDQVFEYHTGAYMPVISDGKRIYLTGYSSLRALEPVTEAQLRAERRAERRAEARRERRQARQRAEARAQQRRAQRQRARAQRQRAKAQRQRARAQQQGQAQRQRARTQRQRAQTQRQRARAGRQQAQTQRQRSRAQNRAARAQARGN